MSYKKIAEELRAEIDKIPIIDTHEHIRRQEDLRADKYNLFTSIRQTILFMDLISAGCSPKLWESKSATSFMTGWLFDPTDERWQEIKPYMDKVQTTASYRNIMIAYRDLYNFQHDKIADNNWRELSDKISKSYERDDWYEFVLKKKLNIDVFLLDAFWDPGLLEIDKKFYIPVLRMDPFLFVKSKKFIPRVGPMAGNPSWMGTLPEIMKKWNASYKTFDEYLNLIDIGFRKILENGGVCIKICTAYFRTSKFDEVSKSKAEKIFNMPEDSITKADSKELEDYIMQVIIEKAIEYNLPIQIHSAVQGENFCELEYVNPVYFNDLFNKYPQAKFVLFHGSFPYTTEAGLFARAYPNVYLDFNWLGWYITDSLRRHLEEWFELIPGNKIMMGGDAECVERAYSSITSAKKQVADVLAGKVETGYYSKNTAIELGRRIFRENARELYNLK